MVLVGEAVEVMDTVVNIGVVSNAIVEGREVVAASVCSEDIVEWTEVEDTDVVSCFDFVLLSVVNVVFMFSVDKVVVEGAKVVSTAGEIKLQLYCFATFS